LFPVVWFFVGYAMYSFQLFPISRISNRWLYMFVYSFTVESDSQRRRFDTCDAIILPMVQKGKVEETVLESVPQLVIQLVNGYLLGEISQMQGFAVFSISLSVLSLSNTMWYYAYWNLFRCKPIRDIPCTLSLYNYKLSGVKEGNFSFAKPSHDVGMSERENDLLNVSIDDSTLIDANISTVEMGPIRQYGSPTTITNVAGGSEIEVARPDFANPGDARDELHTSEEFQRMKQALQDLEAEKLQSALGLSCATPRLRQSAAPSFDALLNAVAVPEPPDLYRLASAAPPPPLPISLLGQSPSKPLTAFLGVHIPSPLLKTADVETSRANESRMDSTMRQLSASSQNFPVNQDHVDESSSYMSGSRPSFQAAAAINSQINGNTSSIHHVMESMLLLYKARVRSSSKLRAFVLLSVFLIYPTLDPGARFSPRIHSFSAGGAKIQLHLCFAIAFVSDAFALPSTQQMLIMLRAELLSSGRSIDEADQLLADACVSPRLHQ
jgi:hypothetical protein